MTKIEKLPLTDTRDIKTGVFVQLCVTPASGGNEFCLSRAPTDSNSKPSHLCMLLQISNPCVSRLSLMMHFMLLDVSAYSLHFLVINIRSIGYIELKVPQAKHPTRMPSLSKALHTKPKI